MSTAPCSLDNCCQTTQTSQTGGHKQAKQLKNDAHATNQRRLLLRRNHRGTRRRPAPRPTAHATKRHAYPTTACGRDTGGRDTGGRDTGGR